MNLLPVLMALSPVVVIFLLLILCRTAADVAGFVGWVVAVGLAWLYFQTELLVTLWASLAGIVASLPIALVVATSILQMTIMLETGAIARVVTLIKSVAPGDQVVQIMLVNVGFGTLLTALGAVPVSILPPIMLALGYSPFAAIALPAIGYDALCTYALLGIPVVVFASLVGQPVDQVGGVFARCYADSASPLDGGENRRGGAADRCRQRDWRGAGQRHLAGQAAERLGQH